MNKSELLSSNLRSIFRTGQLFMQGAYSDEREWVDADEYRLLTRMHRQMCEIAAMRWDEIERLGGLLEVWRRRLHGSRLRRR